ncbi:MAG: ATP-binding protein [bacterium]
MRREIKDKVVEYLIPGRVLVLYGPRRVGKTTLITEIVKEYKGKARLLNAERSYELNEIETKDFSLIKKLVADIDLLVIDEAQKSKLIGDTLKIIVDNFPEKKILISGSSSLDLAYSLGEPLTGRKRTVKMYPFSIREVSQNQFEITERLEELMIYGSYPRVILAQSNIEKENEIFELIESYLYKDILEFENIKNSSKIRDILKVLSFQIGSEVSLSEIAGNVGLSVHTVSKYIELLEKVFVIFKLPGFSRNLRKEVTKNNKYFFYDLGIRNGLINNFNTFAFRDDIGKLWENFCIIERMKFNEFVNNHVNQYFWRTYDQKEVDYIEEKGGILNAFEFTFKDKKHKIPTEFIMTYPSSTFELITKDKIFNFVGE